VHGVFSQATTDFALFVDENILDVAPIVGGPGVSVAKITNIHDRREDNRLVPRCPTLAISMTK